MASGIHSTWSVAAGVYYGICVAALGVAVYLFQQDPVAYGVPIPERLAIMKGVFQDLPGWVGPWLKIMQAVFLSSALFVIWRPEARIYLATIVLNHALAAILTVLLPPAFITKGLYAWTHVLWLVPLTVLICRWRQTAHLSASRTSSRNHRCSGSLPKLRCQFM